jgi:hypothetical protein
VRPDEAEEMDEMTERIDERDAKPLTTAEVEELKRRYYAGVNPRYTAEEWERLLATTRERDDLRAALQRTFQWLPDEEVNAMESERALAFGKDLDNG